MRGTKANLRILLLTHNLAGRGGSYMRGFSLARQLVSLGHSVTFMASRSQAGITSRATIKNGVSVVEMPDLFPIRARNGGLSPIDIAGRSKYVMQPYDIVHGLDHRPAVSLPALLTRRINDIPYVADWADLWGKDGIAAERRTIPGQLLGLIDHYWEKRVHKVADAVTVISSDLETRARKLGVREEMIRLVPVGSNSDEIMPLPKSEMREKHSFPQKAHVLIHVGFAPYDAGLLAETVGVLARADPRIILALTGSRAIEVDKVAVAGGFADRVRQLGFVPYHELGEILACGDVMLLPFSKRTINSARFPNRFGDYLAAGRPIATNLTGDLGSIVVDEGIGIATADNPEEFAVGIQMMLEDDKLRGAMGRRARRLAEGRLSWRTIAETVSNFYEEVLEPEVDGSHCNLAM